MLCVETMVAEGDWDLNIGWAELAERACAAALIQTTHARLAQSDRLIEVSVRFSSNSEVQSLNANYRGKDRPTNVLSFPMLTVEAMETIDIADDAEVLMGDIVLAAGVLQTEASEKRISPADHATHLIVHGMLHLLGYDHDSDADAEQMEATEVAAMAALGLANPYADDR